MAKDDFGIQFDRPRDERGFDIVPRVVTLDKDLSDGAYRTYVVLCMFAWWREASMTEDGDRWCYPGIARISEKRGQSERTILRHIKELDERGWLVRERRGQGQTNRYVIITSALMLVVQGSRGDKFVTSARGDNIVTQRINSNTRVSAAAQEGGEPAPTEQAVTGDKLILMINEFRDLHVHRTREKYLVEWSRDKAAMKRVLATYAEDKVKGMMRIYLTMPRRKYTVAGFAAAVPELIVLYDEWVQKQARKKQLETEVAAITRLEAAFETEASDASERLDALDQKLTALTGEQKIPDEETRKAIDTALGKIADTWSGIFKRACYNAHVPDTIKNEIAASLGGDWDGIRNAIALAKKKRGGESK